MGPVMASIKMTFSLDDSTADRLRRTAVALGKSKSAIVREAIEDYSHRIGKLGETERLRLLVALDEIVQRAPTKPAAEIDAEIAEIRRSRRLTDEQAVELGVRRP